MGVQDRLRKRTSLNQLARIIMDIMGQRQPDP
jgi:hypothetical protein